MQQDWEFLIQHQGDLTWLPLESPTVEILAGCYQVIARPLNSDLAVGSSVTVQITRLFARDSIPQRHFEQRAQSLSPEGLVILPFTFLEAGLWTLCCTHSDASGLDLAVDPEAESVQLQVLPQESEILDSLEPGLPPSIEAKTQPLSTALPTLAISWVPEAFELPRPKLIREACPLLSLDQATYTAQAGEVLTVTGQATLSGPLELCLLDAKTAQVLLRRQQQRSDQDSPDFTWTFEVPVGYPEILGEITLLIADRGVSTDLETQAFRIAVSLGSTVPAARVVPKNEHLENEHSQNEQQSQSPMLDLPTFSQSRSDWCLQVAPKPSLPPKIHQTAAPPQPKSPQLPVLPKPQAPRVVQAVLSGPGDKNNPASMAAAFEALRLRERFWLTLDSLSHEIIVGDGLETLPEQSLDPSLRTASPMRSATLGSAPVNPQADSVQVCLPEIFPASQDTKGASLVPAAVPDLKVPERLVADTPLTVGIQLPLAPPGIGVKLWVYDHHTQKLLDGPHWLNDFDPNPQQEVLETSTQITLPLQIQEVSFVAIAVDPTTQQESSKTIVHRRVDPVDPPDGSVA